MMATFIDPTDDIDDDQFTPTKLKKEPITDSDTVYVHCDNAHVFDLFCMGIHGPRVRPPGT